LIANLRDVTVPLSKYDALKIGGSRCVLGELGIVESFDGLAYALEGDIFFYTTNTSLILYVYSSP